MVMGMGTCMARGMGMGVNVDLGYRHGHRKTYGYVYGNRWGGVDSSRNIFKSDSMDTNAWVQTGDGTS